MTREEAKSCICTIKMLQKLAYNIHGVMDVVDADNCKKIIKALEQEPKIARCENCKHFRKLPYHANTLGKCIQHTGFCPKGDWYCADFEPQESEVSNDRL